MDTTTAIEALRTLTPDALRARLAEIDSEAEALRTLLRAARAKETAIRRSQQRQAPEGTR